MKHALLAVAASFLLSASISNVAFAWTIHGSAPPPASNAIDFGGTLPGFGGTYAGYTDRLVTVAVIPTPGAPCVSGDFVIDGNGMLTVNNAARNWNGDTSPADANYLYNNSNTGYGSKSATYAYNTTTTGVACQVVVSDGAVSTQLAITFTPLMHHYTFLNAQSIHSGGSSYHLDTTSVSQLSSHMYVQANDVAGRQVYLGDTMSGRTSILNYGATTKFDFRVPAMNNVPTCVDGLGPTFWLNRSGTCAGQVNVTSDVQTTAVDAQGNTYYSGGAQIEDLSIDGYTYSTTGAYPTPIAFNFVNFYADASSTDTASLVSYNNGGGWGVSYSHGRVYTDPGNTVWLYKTGLTLTPTGLANTTQDVYVDHMDVQHVALGTSITYGGSPPSGFRIIPHYTNNQASLIAGDFLDWVGTGSVTDPVTILNNFHHIARSTAFNHSDSFQIFPTSQGCGASNPCYYIFAFNIGVRDDEAPGTSIADPITITNAGTYTAGLNTTYTPFASSLTTPLTGSGYGASPSIVTLGASSLTAITIGQNNGGHGYKIGDTIAMVDTKASPTAPGCTLNTGTGNSPTSVCASSPGVVLTVSNITGIQDFQGGPFFNALSSTDYFVCNIHNNISLVTFANGMSLSHCITDPTNGNTSLASNNTILNDFMGDGGVGSPPGVGLRVVIVSNSTDVIATDRNLTTEITKPTGSTISSCYPTATANCGSLTLSDPSQLIAYSDLTNTLAGCVPIYSATSTGCKIWSDYTYFLPNWNTLAFGPDTRGLTINMLTPDPTHGLGPDGSCLGALCPADNHGVVGWAPVGGGVFDATATHTPAQ